MDQQNHRKPRFKKKGLRNAAKLSGIAFQMGLTIYLGNLFGAWLDTKYNVHYWEKTCTMLAIFLSMYSVIVQANRLNK